MRYFVRWRQATRGAWAGDGGEPASPGAFPTITEALDRACDLIAEQRPREIWVVDEHGARAAADFQIRSYRLHRSRGPSRRVS